MIKPTPEILKGCKANDRRAQNSLYKDCFSFLVGVGKRYRDNDQEIHALVNTSFLKILDNLSKYQPQIPFSSWIRRIMINTVIDDYRKNKKRNSLVEMKDFSEPVSLISENDWNIADLELDAEYLLDFVRKLPPMAQKVFNLFAIDGFSHKEIGELLSISDGTSKWHLNDARKRLTTMIKKNINHVNNKSHEKQA